MNEQKVKEAIAKLQIGIHDKREKIKFNKTFYPKQDNSRLEEDIQVYEIAIESLEKQIPMQVKIKNWSPAVCLSCGCELSTHHGDGYYTHPTFLERCPNPNCGQKLKWRE